MKRVFIHSISAPLFALCLFFIGCETTTHTFKVDAINNPEIQAGDAKSFVVVSADYGIDENDPQFKQAAEYVKTALSRRGYYEAPSIEEADLIIEVEYGTSEAQSDYETRAGSNTGGVSTRFPDVAGDTVYGRRRRTRIVRDDSKVVEVMVFEKYLKLTAVDNRESEEGDINQPRAWQVSVKNRDESQDIEKYLPLMTAAAVPYIGEKTEGQEKVTISENDLEVKIVKSGN